jgi:hypothetical protein
VNPLLRSIDDCLLTVKVYQRDVKIHFNSLDTTKFISEPEKEKRRSKRSKIIKFTKRSAKNLRHLIRNSEDTWKVFITLTYPETFPCNGKETKGHLNAFLQYLRRNEIKYAWVLEFQSRAHGENIADNSKGGKQWETKAAKRTKRKARNKRQPNRPKI